MWLRFELQLRFLYKPYPTYVWSTQSARASLYHFQTDFLKLSRELASFNFLFDDYNHFLFDSIKVSLIISIASSWICLWSIETDPSFCKSSSNEKHLPLHKKRSFPLRISSVNVTKSAVSCKFGHIYWRNS